MCCVCGGGDSDTNVSSLPCTDTDNGATNRFNMNCEDYTNGDADEFGTMYGTCIDYIEYYYDDEDFVAGEMCCMCGGG